jgi:hypothetical protein
MYTKRYKDTDALINENQKGFPSFRVLFQNTTTTIHESLAFLILWRWGRGKTKYKRRQYVNLWLSLLLWMWGRGGKQSKTVVNVVGQGHCTKQKMNAHFLSEDFKPKL